MKVAKVEKLGQQGKVTKLVKLLRHDDVIIRAAAADALGAIQDPAAVPALLGVLGDPVLGDSVQIAAAVALGAIRDPAAVQALKDALRDKREAVQIAAADALGAIRLDYHGTPLAEPERAVMFALEGLCRVPIPKVEKVGEKTFGFTATGGHVTALGLYLHRLTALPRTIGNLTSLTYLDLYYNELISLPATIGGLSSLKELRLTKNQLASLPETIGKLSSLEKLLLSHNELTSLPTAIGDLSSLETLRFSHNPLASLPEILTMMPWLQTLSLGGNRLTSLPETFGRLSSLTHLNLEDNELACLPGVIGNLRSLRTLNVKNNQLAFLPETMGNLPSLVYLNLQGNLVNSLPETMRNLNTLNCIELYGNPVYLPDTLQNLAGAIQGPVQFIAATEHSALLVIGRLCRTPHSLPLFEDLGAPGEPGFTARDGHVTGLKLCKQGLRELPGGILARLPALEIVDLRENYLVKLPADILYPPRLNRVDLRGNRREWEPGTVDLLVALLRRAPERQVGEAFALLGDVTGHNVAGDFATALEWWAGEFHFQLGGNIVTFGTETDWDGFRDALESASFMANLDREGWQFGAREMGGAKGKGTGKKGGTMIALPPPSGASNPAPFRPLPATEAKALLHLERVLGRPLPALTKPEPEAFGFVTMGGRVVALCLAKQSLEALPNAVGRLPLLKELYLAGNALTTFPETLAELQALEVLDLRNNPLPSLPATWREITTEIRLDYHGTSLVDPERVTMFALEAACGAPVPVVEVVEAKFTFGFTARDGHVTTLGLVGRGLASLPAMIGQLESLTYLTLGNNQLTSLPATIGNLTSLTSLYLQRNQLGSLPETFWGLKSLIFLDLTGNYFRSLPVAIGNLTSLTHLNLQGNQLVSLPETFWGLKSLKFLDLSDNYYFRSLPATIGNLTSLTSLDLRGNLLISLPETIGNLTSLEKLWLNSKQITSLPARIGDLPSLKEFARGRMALNVLTLMDVRKALKRLSEVNRDAPRPTQYDMPVPSPMQTSVRPSATPSSNIRNTRKRNSKPPSPSPFNGTSVASENLKNEIEAFIHWIKDPSGLGAFIQYHLDQKDTDVIHRLAKVYNEFRQIFNF